MLQRFTLAAALAAGLSSPALAQVVDVVQVCGAASGVVTPTGPGGHLTRDVNGGLCTVIGGGTFTANQGTAATDTPANRWPVLAYQGGTWSVGLSAGAAVLADLRVAGNPVAVGNPVPVSGTVTANQGTSPWTISGPVTQSGTWTVAQGAPGAAAWKVDGSAVTQPVSGTVAATEANGANVALGSTTDAANANTVIGQLKQSNLNLLLATPAAVSTSPPTYATGTTQALSLTTAGALRIDGSGATQPVSSTTLALDATVQARLGTLGQKASAGSAPVVLASDQPAIASASAATAAAGGFSTVSRIVSSAASTNATVAKASTGRVYKITGYNAATSVRWLRFYNTASAPTVGTTATFFALPLPPGAFSFDAQDIGYTFSTGIAYALNTGATDADATAVAAGDILNLNVWVQ